MSTIPEAASKDSTNRTPTELFTSYFLKSVSYYQNPSLSMILFDKFMNKAFHKAFQLISCQPLHLKIVGVDTKKSQGGKYYNDVT